MDQFIVGDRYLVHHLESEAGQLLNGQHVTLADAIIENGRFKCKFDDGTFKQIKPINLLALAPSPTTTHQQQQRQDDADSNSNEKNVTDREETATSSKSPPPKDVLHSDVCSICMDNVSMLDVTAFCLYTCCGKVMHTKCENDFDSSKLSLETKNSCPWCRAKLATSGTKIDIRRLRKWSQKNKRWAQFMLGTRYDEGDGVPQDDKRAFELYRLAADQGHHFAQFNLGTMYAKGRGVNQSDTLAYKYFQLSAAQGYDEAQSNVGAYYANGTGVDQSFAKAREWWTKAAAQGHEVAIKYLKMLDEDEGRTTTTSSTTVTDNTIDCSKCNEPQTKTHKLKNCGCKAAKYCNSTCQTGHWQEHKAEHRRIVKAKGLLNTEGEMKDEVTTDDKKETATALTTHQEEDEEDVCPICLDVLPKDDTKFNRMVCCGKGMHQVCYGKKMKSMSMEQKKSCCLCRRKIPTDPGSKEFIERLHHFVKKGKGWSMRMLGDRNKDGKGVDQSWEQAAYFYKMGVEHGDVSSMVGLGILYMTGQGVEQDNEKGKKLWMKAAALGNIMAIRNLKHVDMNEGKTTPSFTPEPTFCSYCGKAHKPPTTKLSACRGCRCAFYCCKDHQRLDWKMKVNSHKEQCLQLKELL